MADSSGEIYQYPDPPSRGPRKIWNFIKKLFGLASPLAGVRSLQEHNSGLAAFTTEEGKRELDRLVLMEAAVFARLQSATKLIQDGDIESLIVRSGLESTVINLETREEIQKAVNEDEGFWKKLFEKCKSVANEKVKGGIKGWFGGSDKDTADDD